MSQWNPTSSAPPQEPLPFGPESRTSTLAIVSLILGIIGVPLFPFAIVAIILGIIALISINRPDNRLRGSGFAIVGVSLGAIGLIGACLLLGVMLPALGKARASARQVVDSSQLRIIGQGLSMYASKYKDWYPESAVSWQQRLTGSGLVPTKTFTSPIAGSSGPSVDHYLYFPPHVPMPDANTIVAITNPEIIDGESGKGSVLTADGNVTTEPKSKLIEVRDSKAKPRK